MKYAAIDSGSNTFRLMIAEPSGTTAPWKRVDYAHRITRLGEGLHRTGRLSEAAIERAIAAYKEFVQLLKRHQVPMEHTFAAATAAVREAENGHELCTRIRRETGIEMQVISGEEEARMSLAGACSVLSPDTMEEMLLFDIGGGSTEFVRARSSQQIDDISSKLGVVKLVEAHLHSDPPSPSDYASIKKAADIELSKVQAVWGGKSAPAHLVGTAGTITTLAATALDLYPYDAEEINNHHISREAFLTLRDKLLAMTHNERLQLRTIEAGRADLVIAGLAIVEAVMERWNYDRVVAVDSGLLEGLWLQAALRAN